MLRVKKTSARRNGKRAGIETRLHLEALEDRWMPTVAAPLFTATAVSGMQINLGWNSVAGANGYLVDEWINGAWKQIGNFGSSYTGCSVTGLSPNTTYYLDVGAYDASGVSWANYKSAATLQAGPPPAPSFTARAVSGTQVSLAWNSVNGANGYLVDEWINGAWKQIGNFGSSSNGCSVTGLSPNTTYYFQVGAYNASGTGWANYRSVSTPAVTQTFDHPGAGQAYSPVSGALFGANGPSYQDVRQGAVGDCWLLSSLAELAARAPQDIRNMFTYNGTATENGSAVGVYTVRLFDTRGAAHYITVDTELPGGGSEYDQAMGGVLWVALAEKAYAQANGSGFVTTGNVGSDSYNALNNGWPSWALQAITGKSAGEYSVNPSNIAAAWNAGQLIVLCSMSNPSSAYIVGSHAYAVVGDNASARYPFLVYNPWGTDSSGWAPSLENGHQVYGLFNANGAFLSQNFADQSIGVGAEHRTASTLSGVHQNGASQSFRLGAQYGADTASQTGFAMNRYPSHATLDAIHTEVGDLELAANLLGQSWFPTALGSV
jgi:Calpain family cysteine protease